MKRILSFGAVVIFSVFMLLAGVGQAAAIGTYGTVSGGLWYNASDWANNPYSAGGTALSRATATFTVERINFYEKSYTTYDEFLRGGSGNPNGLTWVSDPDQIKDTFFSYSGMQGTFFQLTGYMYLTPGASMTIEHDDGFCLFVGNHIYNYSNPVYITPTTFTIMGITDPGLYPFVLNYGATNGFPEVLTVSAVPEPCTMLLLGSGLAGVAALRRRFKKA